MPTYAYECQACGHAFDELQAMTDAKLVKCPQCRKNRLSRLIGGGSGMIFKGSGFYATDYKKTTASDTKDTPTSAPVAPPSGGCGNCACHPKNK